MTRVAFRCDGDDRIGSGHVGRCLRLAAALASRGAECELVGRYRGGAADLVSAAEVPSRPPEEGRPAGIPSGAEAVVVDSYELPAADVERVAHELPVAAVVDGDAVAAGVTVLSYHPDAPERLGGHEGLLGPDYAPVPAERSASRRPRGHRRVLVTAGGGDAGRAALAAALAALEGYEGLELYVAARQLPPGAPSDIAWGWEAAGLGERIAWADLAFTAAGFTPYELACAGVPCLVVALAENQLQVAESFGRAGVAVARDARHGLGTDDARQAWAELLDSSDALAATGPAVVDGYGALRAADGLLAAFQGRVPEPPLRYRPAGPADSELLLAWRNDAAVKAASRSRAEVSDAEHEAWLGGVLADPMRTLLVVEDAGEPAGTVRFDRQGDEAEISVALAPGRRGSGTGSRSIREASELYLSARPGVRRVVAEVLDHNPASLAAFKRAGYLPADSPSPGGSRWLAYAFG